MLQSRILSAIIVIAVLGILPQLEKTSAQVPIEGKVDLIVESNSFIPAGYQGAAPISIGSTARVTAVGQRRNLGYHWSVNGRLLEEFSGVGQTSITLSLTDQIKKVSVQVKEAGMLIDSTKTTIRPEPVELVLYQNHPTRGPLWQRSLPDLVRTTAAALDIRAIPYGANEERPTVLWRVGEEALQTSFSGTFGLLVSRSNNTNAGRINAIYNDGLFNQASVGTQIQFSIPQN